MWARWLAGQQGVRFTRKEGKNIVNVMKNILFFFLMAALVPSVFAEKMTVRQFLMINSGDWKQISKDTFYHHLDMANVQETVKAVAQGHQPWRMSPVNLILAETGIEADRNQNASVTLRTDNVDFQTYEVEYSGEHFSIDLYESEKVYFPIAISFSEVNAVLSKKDVSSKLFGVVSRLDFPGRPNYQSIRDGDEPETYWILTLEQPTNFEGKDKGEPQEFNIQEVQLFLNEKQYLKFRGLLGVHVGVSGTYFHGTTGHHRTKVLFEVQEMEKL